MPAAEKVKVEMRDGLAAIGFAVDHESIAVGQTQLRCQVFRDNKQVTQQFTVALSHIVGRGQDFFRNDQYMDGCLRIDVMKGQAAIVLIGDFGGDLLFNDLQENVVAEHDDDTVSPLIPLVAVV